MGINIHIKGRYHHSKNAFAPVCTCNQPLSIQFWSRYVKENNITAQTHFPHHIINHQMIKWRWNNRCKMAPQHTSTFFPTWCLHATSGKRIDLNLKEVGEHRMRQISISPFLLVRHDSKSSKMVTFLFHLCILCLLTSNRYLSAP